ncbi:hypothetical protein A2W70_04455 [Candidatus Curtissbacteria bacterium RIFCSPLOWO2_02_41_11]|uniref:Uncharacterized protein n=3 Tax=Candidatus Curtissiibacteriota TaxID=1752717 RepID=A0A1F5HR77_9BACT|nr:MAG: hypothetical protein A2W70_04455 [Candidatus Curtissbacteria bacterium RIFCSPLOWO2_02_41_11]
MPIIKIFVFKGKLLKEVDNHIMQGVIIFAIFYVFIITLQIKSGKGFGMAIDNSSFWQLLVIFGGIATFLINAIWYMQTGKEF